jgi:hypothetical protein
MHLGIKSSASQLPSLRIAEEARMSYLPSILRSAVLVAATLFLAPTSLVTRTATVATVTAVTGSPVCS